MKQKMKSRIKLKT